MVALLLMAIGIMLMAVAIYMMFWMYRKHRAENHTGKAYYVFAALDFVLDIVTGVFTSLYGLYLIIFLCGLFVSILSVVELIR